MAGTLEKLRPSDLAVFHKNPRVGNVEAIAASLRVNDQYRPIVVNKGTHTGRPYEVLAGNHTLKAIRDLAERYPDDERWQNIDCWVLDVDDDRAARIVAADNRTAELGSFDDEVLFDILSELPDLEGTGYEEHDLTALTDLIGGAPSLDDLEREVGGEPQAEDTNVTVRLSVSPALSAQWNDHRKAFDTDDDALSALLDGVDPE